MNIQPDDSYSAQLLMVLIAMQNGDFSIQMPSNLTTQIRNIVDVTTAVSNGDLSKKIL